MGSDQVPSIASSTAPEASSTREDFLEPSHFTTRLPEAYLCNANTAIKNAIVSSNEDGKANS